jgi:hypothetical protein
MMIRIILAIVIVAAVIMAGLNVNGYLSKSLARDALKEQITNANQNLKVLEENTAKIKSETDSHGSTVETARAAIAQAQTVVPAAQIDTNEIVRQILNLGQNYRVNVVPMTMQEYSGLRDKDYECQSATLYLEASGVKVDIINFIKQLPRLYSTLVIDKMSVSRVKEPQNLPAAAAPVSNPALERLVAYLTLVIYTR